MTRWGRGTSEGWSLEIGMAFRGSVVRRDIGREQTTWIASINSTGLGEFLEREMAMRRQRACNVDEMHYTASQHGPQGIRVIRQNRFHHFRLRSAYRLARKF